MNEPFYARLLGRDMAVDLGTANTLVYVRGRGVVLDEPSVVAVNARDGRPLAVGIEAKKMIGRTPEHIKAIRPLKDGVIADFDICEKMLRYFIQRVHPRKWAKPRMVICVPSGITGVEQRAVQEAAQLGQAGTESTAPGGGGRLRHDAPKYRSRVLNVVVQRAIDVGELAERHRHERKPVVVEVPARPGGERQCVVDHASAKQARRARNRVGDQQRGEVGAVVAPPLPERRGARVPVGVEPPDVAVRELGGADRRA